MLSGFKSYAFELQEQCFRASGDMLSGFKSNAFELQELCFWSVGSAVLRDEGIRKE